MSKVRMPYQRLLQCGNVVVAARGSRIDSFSVEDGSLLSTWVSSPAQGPSNSTEAAKDEVTSGLVLQTPELSPLDAASPPAKRRKVSGAGQEGVERTERSDKRKANKRSDAVTNCLEAPAIIALAATKDGRHVIVVTGEDKSIRVLEWGGFGSSGRCLRQISQRTMPKRPCALVVTDDDSTIISADKFGDVYSLPLIPSETCADHVPMVRKSISTNQTPESMPSRPFVPAANDLTVHSVRNRKALENQKRQTNKPSERSEPAFEHTILLGHVSMLTDIALAVLKGRQYIITADRDEHIRVSRGIPHAHIIEGFCLGHTDFVSRLCIPKERPELLISGGGEDDLFVWDWPSGRLVTKLDLRTYVVGVLSEILERLEHSQSMEVRKTTVSGIYHKRIAMSGTFDDILFVVCEGVPALFTFLLTVENHLEHLQTLCLPGNTLDLAFTENDSHNGPVSVAISIDTIHRPGSTTERRLEVVGDINPLQIFTLKSHKLVAALPIQLVDDHEAEVDISALSDRLTNLLYGLELLRKRDGTTQLEE